MSQPKSRLGFFNDKLTEFFRDLAYAFHTVYRADTPPGPAASWLMERLASA